MSFYVATAARLQTRLDRLQRVPKPFLFAGAGVTCAFAGSVIGYTVNPFQHGRLLHLGWWDAVIGLGIGLGIAIVQSWHLGRLEVAAKDLRRAALLSAAGGFAGGIVLWAVKVILGIPFGFLGVVSVPHIAAWTAEGMVIALAVSRAIPNLKFLSAGLAGLGAGFLGGLLTAGPGLGGIVWIAFADAFKGLFIGLAIAVVERLAREAWLVVKRDGAGATSAAGRGLTFLQTPPTVLLGERPVAIGTSPDCAVVVRGLAAGPPVLAEVRLERGLVILRDPVTKREETLKGGQTLRFGDVTLEVGTRGRSREG